MILFLWTHSFCKSCNLVSCSQGPSCKMAGGCHRSHNGGSTSTPLWCFSSASSSASLEGECLLARRHLFCWLVVHAFSVAHLFNQSVSIFILYSVLSCVTWKYTSTQNQAWCWEYSSSCTIFFFFFDDRLYSAILRSLEQTHCARMRFYMSD